MIKKICILCFLLGIVCSSGLFSSDIDLIESAKNGQWFNTDNAVLKFGIDGKALGSVKYRFDVVLENGKKYKKVLLTHPQWKTGGQIKGVIPNISIPKKDARLILSVGFLKGAAGTDGVKFNVSFLKQTQHAALMGVPLCTIDARNDGKLDDIECDLSKVSGETGSIVLSAFAGNSPDKDWAVWSKAVIMFGPKPKPQPEGPDMKWSKNGHSARIEKIEFSSSGRYAVSASADGTAKVWNANNGNLVATLKPGGKVTCARFSPDNRYVVTTSKDAAHVWSIPAGTMIAAFKGHAARVWTADFSPDSNRIATGSEDGTVKIWKLSSKKEILTIQVTDKGSVNDVAYHPKENKLAAGVRGNILGIWDAASGRQIRSFSGHSQAISCVTFNKNGKQLASTDRSGKAIIWNADRGSSMKTLSGHSFHAVCFSPDGSALLTGNGNGYGNIWNISSGKIDLKIEHGKGVEVRSVDFSPDGKKVITASDDGMIKVWEVVY
jgi:WD40 repeat protein